MYVFKLISLKKEYILKINHVIYYTTFKLHNEGRGSHFESA